MNSSTNHHPMIFQAAYHENAPCGLKARCRLGQVMLSVALKNHVVAVAKLIPRARTYSGKASAEYTNGIGPSPEL